MSQWEARIGAIEQNATSRIEAIRIEMSRSLHHHKIDLVDDLATRVASLEACFSHCRDTTERAIEEMSREVRSYKSERSTPSLPMGSNFSVSANLTGMFQDLTVFLLPQDRCFLEARASSIPRASLLGPIEHGSPRGGHAAPVEKASTVRGE